MLVAYGPDEKLVIAGETPLQEVMQWSRAQVLRCPNCRGIVYARGGPEKRAHLHFAHQKGECAWSTEAESVRHMRGKLVIAQWLREQFPSARVTLEERLPGPNRIADVFMTHPDGQRQAIEFQCAPLDLDEWKHRHGAYRAAGIADTWIIGDNRREKQEAFIEAIITVAREALFLDPLAHPPRCWLRWAITREMARAWQAEATMKPLFEGWVGRLGYAATLAGNFQDVRLEKQGVLWHALRDALETRVQLLAQMRVAQTVDEALLSAYVQPVIGDAALRDVLLPLLHAYLRDPDLLRRYNYGRGLWNQPVNEDDRRRVGQAQVWLETLARQGYTAEHLQELANELPLTGVYAAFAGYLRMLIMLK